MSETPRNGQRLAWVMGRHISFIPFLFPNKKTCFELVGIYQMKKKDEDDTNITNRIYHLVKTFIIYFDDVPAWQKDKVHCLL